MNVKQIDKSNAWRYFLIISTLIALHAFFTFYTSKTTLNNYSVLSRSWGFNHVKFYSTPVILSFYLIAFAFAVPFLNDRIYKFLELLSLKLQVLKKTKTIVFICLGIIAGLFFYAFRNKYFLLGDYNLRVTQTMKQEFLATEYVTMKLLYHIASFLGKYNISPIQSFVIVSCASGGIFVTINCFIADILGKNNLQKILLLIGGTVSGMLLIFCGYLDIYAIPLLLTSIYLYTALLYLYNKKYFLLALLSLIAAIGGHLLCVSFAPSLFIIWYYHNSKTLAFVEKMKNKTKVYTILALAVLGVIVVYKMKSAFVLPLKAPPTNLKYITLFSIPHFWEFINGQLLACGISFILVFYLIYKTIKDKIKLGIETYFFMTASAGMFLTVFLANLHRGSSDWDILSFTAITLNSLVILLLFQIQTINSKLANYLLMVVIGFNCLNASLWIHVNHSEKSLAKIEDMLITDPGTYYTSKLPGIIQLIYIYKENKIMYEAERLSLKACDLLPYNDLRGCLLYADLLATQKKEAQAVSFYEELLQKNQNIPQAYLYLINYYQLQKQNEKILPLINQFYQSFKAQPNLFLAHVDVVQCLGLIDYLYNYNIATHQTVGLEEMQSIITQLKQLQQQKPAAK